MNVEALLVNLFFTAITVAPLLGFILMGAGMMLDKFNGWSKVGLHALLGDQPDSRRRLK